MRFFDEYVHDSRAWFKLSLSDPDSEEGTLQQLDQWAVKQERFENAPPNPDSSAPASSGLSDEQVAAAAAYRKTRATPRMRTEGRENWKIAGYLRYRKVYAGADRHLISNRGPAANEDHVQVAAAGGASGGGAAS